MMASPLRSSLSSRDESTSTDSNNNGNSDEEDAPSYPEYLSYDTRLATFANWEPFIGRFSIEELAGAGFFVSNLLRNTKALFCYHCNLFVTERTLRSFEFPVAYLHRDVVCCRLKESSDINCSTAVPDQLVHTGTATMEARMRSTTTGPPVPPRGPNTRLSKTSQQQTHKETILARRSSQPEYMNTVVAATPIYNNTFSRSASSSGSMNAELRPVDSLDDSWDDLDGDDTYAEIGSPSTWTREGPADPLINAKPKMDTYAARLATFSTWPTDSPQDPTTFAKYGMFYTGKEDRTQCHACGVIVWGWEPYKGNRKAPLLAHKKFYRDCKFLQDRSWSDTAAKLNPIGPMINWDKADAPHMMTETGRLSTFKLLSILDEEKAKAMSEAGFYYLSTSREVKCFFCGCVTTLADAQMDPWTAHAQCTSLTGCTFLNRKRGYLFIRKARRRLEAPETPEPQNENSFGELDSSPSASSSGVKGMLKRIVPPNVRSQVQRNSRLAFDSVMSFAASVAGSSSSSRPPSERKASTSEEVPHMEPEPETPVLPPPRTEYTTREQTSQSGVDRLTVIKSVISMGFTVKQVEKALDELANREPPQTPTPENIVQIILDITENERILSASKKLAAASTSDHRLRPTKVITVVPVTETISPIPERLCVICFDRSSEMVFVPCGHVKTCGVCCKMVETCPMCRQAIQDRIRIFL
ncbi:putative Baculoviral IAP repeat-containing protein 7-A [Hypsibius exemplaris]|uniref:Baculoviral IAP repeat-containing protein 7-A n=1 Tax=Hypsibius exemplaris TaxID=2072580 RepID=A0A1W0X459_HYPEX|nr:putative Baculoviral IAP repeat-containing protein 7-A [Hypsibius exemplaris]